MRRRSTGRRKLIILVVASLLVLALLLFTPLGWWLARGVAGIGRGIANLPGIAWLRTQSEMSESSGVSSPGGSGRTGSGLADIDEILGTGLEFQQGSQYERALEHYREALDLDEEYAPAHLAMASLYAELGRDDEALAEMERAAELAPDSGFILGRLGQLYMQRDDYERSVDALRGAIETGEYEEDTVYALAVSLLYRSRADAEKAIEGLELAAQRQPDEAGIYYHLANAYMWRDGVGDEQRAIDALNRALELDDTLTEPYFYLGRLYMRLGDRENAVAAWRQYVNVSDDAETVAQVREFLSTLEE